jgi:predicted DNA-binding antitoxin AbrB/MazE fold protein
MTTTQVEATFTNGVLKPDRPLPLANETRVRVTIEPVEERLSPIEAWAQLKQWIREHPLHGLGRHLSRDELHERR